MMGDEGRWAKQVCEKSMSFICKASEDNVIRNCDVGFSLIDFGNGEKEMGEK